MSNNERDTTNDTMKENNVQNNRKQDKTTLHVQNNRKQDKTTLQKCKRERLWKKTHCKKVISSGSDLSAEREM